MREGLEGRMRRDTVYYVMPVGDVWLVRAIGSAADVYPTYEDALAAAARLSARGACVRILARAAERPAGLTRDVR